MKTIIPRLVPAAICGENVRLRGRSCRAGTTNTPPPTPNIAATIPTDKPMRGSRNISNIGISNIFASSNECSLTTLQLYILIAWRL